MAYGQINEAGLHEFVRLESRTSTKKSVKVQLQANVHDALWMLSRQYDVGEFKGENAGSAIQSVVSKTTKPISKFKNNSGISEINNLELLEPKVEKLKLRINILARLQMGRYWNKLLKQSSLFTHYGSSCFNEFSFNKNSLDSHELELIESDEDTAQISVLINGILLDGWRLYNELKSIGTLNGYGAISVDASDIVKFNDCEANFLIWVQKNYEPTGASNNDNAWNSESLEYSFECSIQEDSSTSSTDQTVVVADEFQSGKLDWYSFNLPKTTINHGNNSSSIIQTTTVQEFLPSKISYKGALSARWWEFDDAIIDLSNTKFIKHDIPKLLTINHLLNFTHDWKIIPLEIPMGTLVNIDSVKVKDVFGDETSITPLAASTNWNMFTLNKKGDMLSGDIEGRLFVPPVVVKRMESKAIEEVIFVRDEMANMVWGIERIMPDIFSGGKSGDETIKLLEKYYEENSNYSSSPIDGQVKSEAKKKYSLSTQMPENWIPFIPAKQNAAADRSVSLQRATFYRIINNDITSETIRPRTSILLADGSKLPETPTPYFIKEEEILQNGIIVKSTHQRARDYNGSVKTWLGRYRYNGDSKKSSNLKFDSVLPYTDTDNSLVSSKQWLNKLNLSPNTMEAAIFSLNDKIYVAGGTNGVDPLAQVREYDLILNSYIEKADWESRIQALGIGVNDVAYLIGGHDGDPSNINHELNLYNPDDDSWSQICNVPIINNEGGARLNAVLVELRGKLYYGLGDYNGTVLSDWWEYDIDSNNWVIKSHFPTPITQSAYFVLNEEIYVLGGKTDIGPTFDCWKYDVNDDTWYQIASLPNPKNEDGLYQSGGFVLNNYGYVCAGAHSNNLFSKDVWLYDAVNDAWCKISEFLGSNAMIQSCTVVSNDKAYIMGGYKQDGTVCEEIWEFTF